MWAGLDQVRNHYHQPLKSGPDYPREAKPSIARETCILFVKVQKESPQQLRCHC